MGYPLTSFFIMEAPKHCKRHMLLSLIFTAHHTYTVKPTHFGCKTSKNQFGADLETSPLLPGFHRCQKELYVERHQWSFPTLNHACYNTNLGRCTYRYNSGMAVMKVTKYFLIGYEVCFIKSFMFSTVKLV